MSNGELIPLEQMKVMAFLTIFTAPKPFTNPHINIIQRNALSRPGRAWQDVEVILIGDEPGIPEAAREFGVKNVPKVKRDERASRSSVR